MTEQCKSYQSTMSTKLGSANESLTYWMKQEMMKHKPSRRNGISRLMTRLNPFERFFDRLMYWFYSPR